MVKQSTLRKILGQGNQTREQAAYREDRVTKEHFYSNEQISEQAACREDIVTEERVMAYITSNSSTC